VSRSAKGSKGAGYDYWSRRCFGNRGASFGPVAKRITKRKERMRNREIERLALVDPDMVPGRFPGE